MDDVLVASYKHNILQFQKFCGATLDESNLFLLAKNGENSWGML